MNCNTSAVIVKIGTPMDYDHRERVKNRMIGYVQYGASMVYRDP